MGPRLSAALLGPALLLAPPILPAVERPYEIEAVTIPAGDIELGGLLYRDREPPAAPGPAVVVLHGWLPGGSHGAGVVATIAHAFHQQGYVALALSLRGWPPSGGVDDCGGRQPGDVATALQWLAARADVDARAIGLVGYSQGGQVALLAAARSARVRAVVAYAAPADLPRWRDTTDVPGIVGYVNDVCERGGGTSARSPITVADRIDAPVLLIHGERDTRVPAEQSRLLADAIRDAGGRVQLSLLASRGHYLGEPEALSQALGFLAESLGPRPAD